MRRVAYLCISLFLFAEYKSYAQQDSPWSWKDRSGNIRTRSDLDEILQKHQQWRAGKLNEAEGKANLSDANLTDGHLDNADLTHALFIETDLSGARISGATLDGALFEPKVLPDLRGIAAAKNLQLLTYKENPDALVQLRKQFEDGGFREQERKITYVLKRREAELSWGKCTSRGLPKDQARAIVWSSDSILANFASFILNKVFFDWTC